MSARKVNWALLSTLAFLAVAPAAADEPPPSYRRPHHGYRIYLPPERHVIEVVQPPWSGNFIINGRHFTGTTPACFGWAAGERIRLIEGDWNGRCVEAVFYNITRHSTCVTICGWSKFDRWNWW